MRCSMLCALRYFVTSEWQEAKACSRIGPVALVPAEKARCDLTAPCSAARPTGASQGPSADDLLLAFSMSTRRVPRGCRGPLPMKAFTSMWSLPRSSSGFLHMLVLSTWPKPSIVRSRFARSRSKPFTTTCLCAWSGGGSGRSGAVTLCAFWRSKRPAHACHTARRKGPWTEDARRPRTHSRICSSAPLGLTHHGPGAPEEEDSRPNPPHRRPSSRCCVCAVLAVLRWVCRVQG